MLGVVVELFLVMGLTWASEVVSLAVNWAQRGTHLGIVSCAQDSHFNCLKTKYNFAFFSWMIFAVTNTLSSNVFQSTKEGFLHRHIFNTFLL